jgi:hypothetical protein
MKILVLCFRRRRSFGRWWEDSAQGLRLRAKGDWLRGESGCGGFEILLDAYFGSSFAVSKYEIQTKISSSIATVLGFSPVAGALGEARV